MYFQDRQLVLFKKAIIIFWTIWWVLAFWTDFIGMFAHMKLIQKSWAPDANYPFLVEALKMYEVSALIPQMCFAGILIWSFLSSIAFIWTCIAFNQEIERWMKRADTAFIISLCFWLAMFLADQLVMKFDLEENHMVQGGFQLLTYLTLYILPTGIKDS
ncbi:hypothetical protein [Legionella bononiensis]|uniref:Transmembrane protein n=1 Tax=Legionella bononiensis TaxID=2793102 RepID=A0ABS1W7R1_9GAMM|nr:hypothetical protein [Legionella bononiensis]MBL7480078.1 hypothetical protein [Legionella bononiensis]MBL7525407.1 hypothetical protein [Legionella bononiensis]MBL7561591.1 hypothetical protein [Legionella bononiensis]